MRAKIDDFKKRDIQNMDYQSLFLELKELCFPLFKYKQGNCHNIVHYCSMILESKGIKHKKIWYFTPALLKQNSNICISKPDPNNLVATGNLDWGYHVAILFELEKNSLIFDWIMDEKYPLTFKDWLDNLGLKEYQIDIEDPKKYLFNIDINTEDLNSTSKIKYFEYKGFSKDNFWLPAGLAINETAYVFFQTEKEILEGNTKDTFDYKTLVGNILNFERVIRDQFFNNTVNKDFQKKHNKLIEKYMLIYQKNLKKWIDILDYWKF
jgi:hypothetical protein